MVPDDVVVLPPASLPPFVMVGVSTWADRLTLAVGFPPGAMPRDFVTRVLDLAIGDLDAAAADASAETA